MFTISPTATHLPTMTLAPMLDSIPNLRAIDLYREDVQGALALNRWLSSIEFGFQTDPERKAAAKVKIDFEIAERLGEIHNIT